MISSCCLRNPPNTILLCPPVHHYPQTPLLLPLLPCRLLVAVMILELDSGCELPASPHGTHAVYLQLPGLPLHCGCGGSGCPTPASKVAIMYLYSVRRVNGKNVCSMPNFGEDPPGPTHHPPKKTPLSCGPFQTKRVPICSSRNSLSISTFIPTLPVTYNWFVS